MSYGKPLVERERALEEAFFQKANARLLEKMRERKAHDAQWTALSEALGIANPTIIDPLLELGLRESNVTALMLAPLVAVAWADRMLDNEERSQLLEAESELGIEPESDAGKLLATWLDHRPHEALLDAWSAYVTELCRSLESNEREQLRKDILHGAHRIAHALEKSFLRGGRTTRAERAVLDRIETTFAREGDPMGSRLDDLASAMT